MWVLSPAFFVYTIRMWGITYFAEVSMEEENSRISRGLQSRDPDVLDSLIEQYQQRLSRYLVFFTRDRQLAEDLFQETWIRVLERGWQFDPRYKFESWLLRVARNLAIDAMRRKTPILFTQHAAEEDMPFDPPAAEGTPSAFDFLAAAESRQRLGQVMDGIPPYYREVLTLRFHEGMSLEEIASFASIPLSTVKSRLRRGLHLLSTRLGGDPL